jgi:hypothetical protein
MFAKLQEWGSDSNEATLVCLPYWAQAPLTAAKLEQLGSDSN